METAMTFLNGSGFPLQIKTSVEVGVWGTKPSSQDPLGLQMPELKACDTKWGREDSWQESLCAVESINKAAPGPTGSTHHIQPQHGSGNPAASATVSQLLVTINNHQVLMTVKHTTHKEKHVPLPASQFTFPSFWQRVRRTQQRKTAHFWEQVTTSVSYKSTQGGDFSLERWVIQDSEKLGVLPNITQPLSGETEI